MNLTAEKNKPETISSTAVGRLTALWALHEAGLGGLLHIFTTSFEGLIMAGFATVLITLIAYFSNRNQSVLFKSLVLVMITKIIASPHSGFPAYTAVMFQGVVGIFVFKYIRSFKVAAITLAIVAFLESALQRIFLMILMFGKPLWDSLDIFITQLGLSFGIILQNGSFWIFGLYLLIYLIGGIMFGRFAYYLTQNLKSDILEEYKSIKIDDRFIAIQHTYLGRKRANKSSNVSVFETIMIGSIISVVLLFLSPQKDGWQTILYTVVRCASFVILWFFILNPILTRLFKIYFSKKQTKYQSEVEDIFEFMSTLRKLTQIAWQETAKLKGIKRIKAFVRKTIAFTLLYENISY